MRNVWLDVDPGHDDATAIMLALNSPNIRLLGISTTHGNASSDWTAINAARCVLAFGAVSSPRIHIYPGAQEPLLLPAKHDPEIHGEDGLGGVEGLPSSQDPAVLELFGLNDDGTRIHAVEAIARHVRKTISNGSEEKVTIISTGPMTNVALFVSMHPELLSAVDEFIFMGGGVGMGNRSAVAEYNILCDPHAAQIVLNAPVKKTMIPINVTHTAIVTKEVHRRLLSPLSTDDQNSEVLPRASTNLRHTLSTLISFFAESYKSTFGFNNGPPLHDALTIAYASHPELFATTRHRVDIELTGSHSTGETVVDVWRYKACDDTWGRTGRNCMVAESLKVDEFFDIFLEAVARCDAISSLNSNEKP